MTTKHAARIGEAASKMAALREDELPLVIEFVTALGQRRGPRAQVSVAEIRELAKERARLLGEIPRDVLMARFLELAEEIRHQAIAQKTAVDGDWKGG